MTYSQARLLARSYNATFGEPQAVLSDDKGRFVVIRADVAVKVWPEDVCEVIGR